MNRDLLQKLKSWRRKTANLEGVELFRVFANKVLENISELKPINKEELMAIKGIRDKKFAKYGKEILAIINSDEENLELSEDAGNTQPEKPFSVSAYIDFLNQQLRGYSAKIQGEISSADVRERVVYFSLKDSEDESVINCLIWKRDYELCGINFETGMEVILEGAPDIYKPSGRLSFKALSVELVGEGALKKAYDQLKKKLMTEGLFLVERKKEIPALSQKIGLITSETGAVIHDFLNNLGRYGFQIKFVDSRVEGQVAVRDLISAIDYFNDKDIDLLVIIRGGGSLESLQAFNNEILVRRIADFSKPIICGIGHDKDVPLTSLTADLMVSTPTAVAHALNASWQSAIQMIEPVNDRILDLFNDVLSKNSETVNNLFQIIKDNFELIFRNFNRAEESLKRSFISLRLRIAEMGKDIARYTNFFSSNFTGVIIRTRQVILSLEKLILTHNPERQLKLGYSIVRSGGKIVKSVAGLKIGEAVDVALNDGEFNSEIKNIKLCPKGTNSSRE